MIIFDRFSNDSDTRILPEGTRYLGSKSRVIPVPDPNPSLWYPEPTRNRLFDTRYTTIFTKSLKGNHWVGKCVKIPLFPSVNDGKIRPKWAFTTCRQVQVHKMEFGHSRNLITFKIVDELFDFKNFQCLLLFVFCIHIGIFDIGEVANAISWLVNNSLLYTFLTNQLRPLKPTPIYSARSVPTLSISVIFIQK